MKSFNNFYIRNKNSVELQNTLFVSPLITTNSYLYYNSFTQTQKDNFKWTGGGNWIDPQGPVIVFQFGGFLIHFHLAISVLGYNQIHLYINLCI